MPQLNPTPWFLTMTAVWLTISIILTLINNTNLINNPPTDPHNKTVSTNPWIWPW